MRWLERILSTRRGSGAPLVEAVSATGGPPAVWSYGEVLDAAVALAGRLRETAPDGPRRLHVGLVTRNSVEWLVADLACLLAGAV